MAGPPPRVTAPPTNAISWLAHKARLVRLPRGGALSADSWRSRHAGITTLLWLKVFALVIVGVCRGFPPVECLAGPGSVAVVALGASSGRFGRNSRSAMATLGLVMSSSVLVYFFDGRTEAHFDYFVMVAVVALYQAWWPYLLAVGFVLVQHGVVGAIAPQYVYGTQMGRTNVWLMAAIHGGFILAESIACVLFWRVSEDALVRERRAVEYSQHAQRDLILAQELAGIGSWTLDMVTNRLTWSDQMYTLTKTDPDTFTPTMAASLGMIHPDDQGRLAVLFASGLDGGESLNTEYRLLLPDQEVRVVHALSERPIEADGTATRTIGTIHDVTERASLQQEIEHLAYHDPLTGLGNRRLFLGRLEQALTRQRAPGCTVAVLYLDLDDFKLINDTMGHSVGDELLRFTAGRLETAVRTTDTIGRLGGDEFAILLENVDLPTARRIAELVGTQVRQPLRLEGVTLSIHVSIGFALAGDHTTADDLLKNADAAMYVMKTRLSASAGSFPADPPDG